MVMDEAPCSPICSRRGANPPDVPCPPHMGMDPAAMPSKGLRPSPFAIPTEMRFCATIRTATRPIITSSGLPPRRRTRTSDWKPTDVKNSIMQRSFTVPSNWHSTPKTLYRSSVRREIRSPPDTGAGMQKRLRKASFRVKSIPRSRATTPTPALAYISSVIVMA